MITSVWTSGGGSIGVMTAFRRLDVCDGGPSAAPVASADGFIGAAAAATTSVPTGAIGEVDDEADKPDETNEADEADEVDDDVVDVGDAEKDPLMMFGNGGTLTVPPLAGKDAFTPLPPGAAATWTTFSLTALETGTALTGSAAATGVADAAIVVELLADEQAVGMFATRILAAFCPPPLSQET